MALEENIFAIKAQLDELSRSLTTDNRNNNVDHEFLQLTNELSRISEKLIEGDS